MTHAARDLWVEVRGNLRAFISKRVATEADAEDILQDVFLRIHEKIGGLRDPRRVLPWIYQMTRHAIIDHYRAPQRRREVTVGLAADVEAQLPAVEQGDETGEPHTQLAGCLRPMVEQLSPDYRQAIRLVELEGLTQQAAASRMGISLSGMKSRVQRGRRQLKAMLQDCCLIRLDARRGVAEFAPRHAAENLCTPPPVIPTARRPSQLVGPLRRTRPA